MTAKRNICCSPTPQSSKFDVLTPFFTALAVVFLAEIGDKSLLLAMAFGARHRLGPVLLGIATASIIAVGVAVSIGEFVSRFVPEHVATVTAAVLFVVIGIALLLRPNRSPGNEPGNEVVHQKRFASVYLSVVAAFVLAEIGDKTMLMVITLAASQHRLAVYAGSVLGMFAAASLGAVFAHRIAAKLKPVVLARIAGSVFVLVGSALAIGALAVPS